MDDKEKTNILNQSLDQIMSDRFARYSKYIIQGRALPDVRDGLKPVQRRIIFAMNEIGLFNDKPFKKSARIVGEVIGKYHPHGDSSIYEAMVRMGQEWKINEPLIEMHGNKGSVDDDPPAAMRYTEARLAKITKELLNGVKKETVSFAPNFDDSEIEPTVLPGLMPNLLVNGAKGIASGYATEMPPHNLGEIIDGIIHKIKSPNAKIETLLKYVKGPDFPTRGEVQGKEGIEKAFLTGQGRIIIRSKYNINNSKTNPSIEIVEIPFGVIKSKLIREIDEKRINNSISGIKEVRDESDRNGISIKIELSPKTKVQAILNYLLSKTDMQIYYNYNNVGIVERAPKLLSLSELMDAYIKHQKEVQTSLIKYDLSKYMKRSEILEGLIKVSLNIDSVIDTIRKVEGSKKGVVQKLIEKFNFTEIQANAISDLKLYRLSRTDQSIYLDEQKELLEKIEINKKLLNNENELNSYLILLLKILKKNYAKPRQTNIKDNIEKIEINMENLIKNEDVWIGISKKGYLKRISNRIYESNKLEKYTFKNDDSISYLDKINTSEKLLIFTSKGKYLTIPVHKIKDNKWKDIGKHINDFANIDSNEFIITAISVKDFSLNIFFIFATKNGKIKRTSLKDLKISRYSKTFIAIKLEEKDSLISVKATNGKHKIIIITTKGKAVKYNEEEILVQGLKTRGIKGISLIDNSFASSMITGKKNDLIGLISSRGGVKIMKIEDIKYSSRISQGKEIFKKIKSKPHLIIDAKVIKPNASILFIDKDELIKLFHFKDINITSNKEGLSLLGNSSTIDGCIIKFDRINNESDLLKETENIKKEEEKFFSIDDILKI